MSKIKKIVIGILIISIIVLGGLYYIGSKVNESYYKAIEYLNNKEYDKTITALDISLDDNKDDEKSIKLRQAVESYINSEKELNGGDFAKAKQTVDSIKDYGNCKSFEADVNKLKLKVEEAESKNSDFINKTKQVRENLEKNELNKAQKDLEKIEKDELNKEQIDEIEVLKSNLNSKISKERELQKAKEEKIKKENARKKDTQFIEDFKNSSRDLTEQEAEKLLKLKIGDGGKVAFTYIGSTGVQASILYEYLQNYTTSHTHGPHVYVNASTGEIMDQDYNVLSAKIRPLE